MSSPCSRLRVPIFLLFPLSHKRFLFACTPAAQLRASFISHKQRRECARRSSCSPSPSCSGPSRPCRSVGDAGGGGGDGGETFFDCVCFVCCLVFDVSLLHDPLRSFRCPPSHALHSPRAKSLMNTPPSSFPLASHPANRSLQIRAVRELARPVCW